MIFVSLVFPAKAVNAKDSSAGTRVQIEESIMDNTDKTKARDKS
jgi:hypothetical protein